MPLADTDMSAVFLVPLQEVANNDPEYKQHMVRYCYDTQCFLLGQSDYAPHHEGHVLFSILPVVSGITQPSHDAKNYVFIRGRGFNEPCSMCFVTSLCSFTPSIS